VFNYDEDPTTKLITATVTLPTTLKQSLRSFTSQEAWLTERAAKQDAAFQAYTALFEAGLLNDHLLPLSEADDEIDAMINGAPQFNPWVDLSGAWSRPNVHQRKIRLQSSQGDLHMLFTTPLAVPHISPFDLYWDDDTTFTLHFSTQQPRSSIQQEDMQTMRRITHLLTRSTHSDNAVENKIDFIALFSPDEEHNFESWFAENSGRDPALKYEEHDRPRGFVRSPSESNNAPHIFRSWAADDAEIECTPLPRRRHFLARNTLATASTEASKNLTIPIEDCTIDRLPFRYARFALFIPAILQHLEALMVADRLSTTILKDVSIKDKRHISTAIIAPSAGWRTNYQRYEFFGDTVLKFSVSYQLFCDHECWHEGHLTQEKNRTVSNRWLAKHALLKGLDQFIMTEPLETRKKWPPRLMSDIKRGSGARRNLSSKVIADVVESLTGAAYIDSGMDSARQCIHAFLSDIRAPPPPLPHYPTFTEYSNSLAILKHESMVGRQFSNRTLLVEALTHPSYRGDVKTESYQRLEFLGDAVLDMVIVSIIAARPTELTQGQMTLIKAAVVNCDFLGFLCLDFSISEDTAIVTEQSPGTFATQKVARDTHLWSLLRAVSPDIVKAQIACGKRYRDLRAEIKGALCYDEAYPWLHLTRLRPDKFFSDMIESLIGAIFVDSGGDLAECQRFVERIGLTSYLDRLLDGSVDVVHPKAALGEIKGVQGVVYLYDVRVERGLDQTGFGEYVPLDTGCEECYQCTVLVNGAEVARATGCLCKEEAAVAGALAAIAKLKGGSRPSS
jgi:dsRNA-specific ribonuclease